VEYGPRRVSEFLESVRVDSEAIRGVIFIMRNISFHVEVDHAHSGSSAADKFAQELNIVQDADRLDAIGAIGIPFLFDLFYCWYAVWY
jgi:uncharacterized protein